VNLQAAKDQKLSLNPSQISGACGRLMCCLRYEHEFYAAARKRFPKEGKIVTTAVGEEKIALNDIFNERVTLRNAEGESRTITLVEYKAEIAGVVQAAPPAVEEEREDTGTHAIVLEGETILEDEGSSAVAERRAPSAERPPSEVPKRRRRGRRGGRREGGGSEGGPPPAPPAP
jgi:hypothetical protein